MDPEVSLGLGMGYEDFKDGEGEDHFGKAFGADFEDAISDVGDLAKLVGFIVCESHDSHCEGRVALGECGDLVTRFRRFDVDCGDLVNDRAQEGDLIDAGLKKCQGLLLNLS